MFNYSIHPLISSIKSAFYTIISIYSIFFISIGIASSGEFLFTLSILQLLHTRTSSPHPLHAVFEKLRFFSFYHFKNLGYIPARSQFRLAPRGIRISVALFPLWTPVFFLPLSLSLSFLNSASLWNLNFHSPPWNREPFFNFFWNHHFFFPHPPIPLQPPLKYNHQTIVQTIITSNRSLVDFISREIIYTNGFF